MRLVFVTIGLCCVLSTPSFAQGLLKGLVDKNTVENIANSLVQEKNIDLSKLVGTWKYTKPACEFTSKELLKQAGGSVMASQVEEKLSEVYSKLGLSASQFSMTFNADSTFTCRLKEVHLGGKVALDREKGVISLRYEAINGLVKAGTIEASLRKTGNKIRLLYNADKLLKLLSALGHVTDNPSLNMVGKLAAGYDGLLIGFELEK